MIKVEKNIGILNAMIRITIGLVLLSLSTAKLAKRPYCNSYLVLSICGAMKVAEGIVRYCPITALFKNQDESHPQEETKPEAIQSFIETVQP